MTDITTQRAYTRPVSVIERRAEALDELRQLHIECEALQSQSVEDKRLIVHLNDRNQFLLEQLRISQQTERVAMRKLMRLSQSMSNIGRLTEEAQEIMKSAQEYQDEIDHSAKEPRDDVATVNAIADQISAMPAIWQTDEVKS
jgi:hypothetical protein